MISLALTVLALAASAAATGYRDGREYVYRYNGAIYTGYPGIKPQEAGYVYNLKLIVQPEGDHAIFKVDDAKKAQFNGEFENVMGAPHTYNDLPPGSEFLMRPFRVTRRNGIVTQFEVTRDEPSFSVNMKRGIVSLFNLNLGHVESDHADNDILRSDPDPHYYKVYEEGLLGDCETAYVIEHHPYDRSHNIVLNITKARDFHNCRTRPNQVYGREYYGFECGKNDDEKAHTLHGNAYYHYSIRGDRHHHVIEKIVSESDADYTPYPIHGERVSTMIRRYLELVEERAVSTQLQLSGEVVSYSSMLYDFAFQRDFNDPIDLQQPHFLYHLTGRKVPLQDVRAQVDDLLKVYKDDTYAEKIKDRNYPAKYIELLRSVATLGFSDFEELYMLYANIPEKGATEEQELARSLFVDTLVNLGTNPAFLFGKKLIEENKARPGEAEYFIRELQFHLKEVSKVLLEQYQDLCESEYVKKRTQLHSACVMSLANIVYDNCVARYHPDGLNQQVTKDICPYDQAIKYFHYIARLYEQTSDEQLKMDYVQAAGKLGVKEVLPYLIPYVKGTNTQNRLYRDNAIWSLMNVGRKALERVRGLLIPLLFNRTEPSELRISAFTVLLQYQPGLYEVETIARALKHDPDDQLRSYIYSAFKYLGNSSHVCDRNQSYAFQYGLRILEDVKHEFEEYDYSYSKLLFFGSDDPDYKLGGSTVFAHYANDNGWFPRKLYLAFQDFIGGKSILSSSVTFRQYGLEKFFDKIFGPEGTYGKRSVFDLFKKRDRRDVSGARKELNEIKEKMNLPVYDYGKIEGELFLKFMGRKTFSYYFDERTFQQFFKEGRFVIPNIPAVYQNVPAFYRQRFMLTVDKFYVMPTESGLPLLFDYKQPVYFYHRNKQSSLKVEPGFFAEERGGQWPEHVKLETDGHIAIDKNLIAYMGVVIPFDQVFFGGGINERLTLSLPLKLKVDLDLKERKLKTHWTPVAPHEVFHFKYEPYTFVDSYANSVPQVLEDGYKPVRRVHRHEVERHFFHDEFGVGFDIKADYENEFDDFGSWVDFFLKKDLRQRFYYLYANPHFEPYHVDVQFSHANQGATKELEVDFTYLNFEDNWIIPHFPEENFEDYEKQRDGRGPISTCVVKADVHGTGDKERKIHAVASVARDLLRTFYKLNFFYERTPFASYETEPFKICGSSYLKYPRYDWRRLEALDTLDIDHTVNTELRVNFGKNCHSDQKIKLKGLITETEQQHEFERHREEPDTPEHYNDYSRLYHQCQEERQRGINYGEACMEYLEFVTILHKYTLHIKHENLSPSFLNRTYLLDRILKFVMYTHSDHNEIGVHNPVDEVHIEANFSSKLPVADIRVQKPVTNTNYYNVYFPHYVGFRSYPMHEDILVKRSFSDLYCAIEGDEVLTFDRYKYNLPPIDCYKVIAKDCTPKEYFTVLGTKIKHSKYHKAVKVFLGNHKIEALPVSENSEIIVRVDGQKIDVANYEPYVHKEGDETLFYVTFRDIYYALHSEKYGLIVEYDGHSIFVQVSPYYRAKLCGLCGNYNGQRHDGATTTAGCYYRDEKEYAYSYTVPSDTCATPRPEPVCPSEGGFGCFRLRTKVIQLTTSKVPQTCFSTEPVPECSAHCQSPGMVSRTVSFHCLPSKDDSTKSLVRESENRVLYELSRKSKDDETTVEVPDGCYKK